MPFYYSLDEGEGNRAAIFCIPPGGTGDPKTVFTQPGQKARVVISRNRVLQAHQHRLYAQEHDPLAPDPASMFVTGRPFDDTSTN